MEVNVRHIKDGKTQVVENVKSESKNSKEFSQNFSIDQLIKQNENDTRRPNVESPDEALSGFQMSPKN
jgi:hypothetical protein